MPGTLTHWDPFADLADIRARFERLFGDLADGREREWMPAVDMVRDDGHLILRADAPGFKPEEITVEVDGDVLTVAGKHEESKEEETDEHLLRRERRFGSFSRTVTLPKGVEAKRIKAETRDGVLEVTIPLPKETAKEKITITPKAAA
jgi:HSP20 family protein